MDLMGGEIGVISDVPVNIEIPTRWRDGGLLPGGAPRRSVQENADTPKWGIFNRPIWGEYGRH